MITEDRLALSAVEFWCEPMEPFWPIVEELGIKVVELWYRANIPDLEHVSKFEEELSRRELSVCCVSVPSFLAAAKDSQELAKAQKEVIEGIKVAKELGAGLVSTFFGRNPDLSQLGTLSFYRRAVGPCLEEAERAGVTLLIENEFDPHGADPKGEELVRTAEGCLAVLEAVGSARLKLNFDLCNFYVAGEEPYPLAYEMLKGHIGHVHVKDAVRFHPLLHGDKSQYKIWTDTVTGPVICVPVGEGTLNYPGFIAALKRDGYDGYMSLEPHTHKDQLLQAYRRSVEYLRKVMAL